MNRIVAFTARAVLNAGDAPDVGFVPPLVRRRLSPLQKIYFALAESLGASAVEGAVFASRDGEDSLTRRIVDEFRGDGTVSPHRFSASVYNAAPGLWSISTKNRAPYTAIAAGEDSIECAVLEALGARTPALCVYAEETDGGYGAAFILDAPREGEKRYRVSAGDGDRAPVGFADLTAFLKGEKNSLEGRWLTITEI